MRYSCALMAQVYAEPLSEITVPNKGFAITFTQGAGVVLFLSVIILYSLPFLVKPPVPLKDKRSLGSINSFCSMNDETVLDSSKGPNGLSAICRLTCSNKLPLLSERLIRATLSKSRRSSEDIWSADFT